MNRGRQFVAAHPQHRLPEAQRQILDALDCAHDERLWQGVRQHSHEDQALGLVSLEAPRLIHRRRGGPEFLELWLIPVIEQEPGTVLANPNSWEAAAGCLPGALERWAGSSGGFTIFQGVRPYGWIAAWEPSAMRQHLRAQVPGAGADRLQFQPFVTQLPQDAPQLGFITLSVRRRLGWPQLPRPDTLGDARFREVVGHSLHAEGVVRPPQVLPPDRLSAALADGLCLWLSMLQESHPIARWHIEPCADRSDALRLCLSFSVEPQPPAQLVLRKYQLGTQGVKDVLRMLCMVAPMEVREAIH